MTDATEKYFVICEAEYPVKICFSKKDAFKSGATYIDSFNKKGEHVKAYKIMDYEYDEKGNNKYTTDF